MNLQELKTEYLLLLMDDSVWREDEKEMVRLHNEFVQLLSKIDGSEPEFIKKFYFKTKLLETKNQLKSPLNLNLEVELPLAEYYLDESNFVVYTTSGIYYCKKANLSCLKYSNLKNDSGEFINRYYDTINPIYPTPLAIEIEFETKSGDFFPVLIETSIPKKPIFRLILYVMYKHKD